MALELDGGATPLESVQNTLQHLRGTWGLCILFRDHDLLICAAMARHSSSVKGRTETFVSSDPHPLTAHTQRVVYLEDGDLAVIQRGSFSITNTKGRKVKPNITVLEEAWGEADLGDAPHYMYKEIYEQPDALRTVHLRSC